MELTSFVSPKWVPQLKDAGDIITYCSDENRNLVLTPNEKGIARAKKQTAKTWLFCGSQQHLQSKEY